jgi:5-methylcytosine-specific restriction protein A
MCATAGRLTTATEVDHVTPHRGDAALFWLQSNWQPLCHRHHSEKTAREDGRWG